jgi:hypothetical protein
VYFLVNEDDDDGLPNEYDYQDSFIDDEDTGDSTNDEEGIINLGFFFSVLF